VADFADVNTWSSRQTPNRSTNVHQPLPKLSDQRPHDDHDLRASASHRVQPQRHLLYVAPEGPISARNHLADPHFAPPHALVPYSCP
jgi:hypothetical protein